jgi:hypothetical protein
MYINYLATSRDDVRVGNFQADSPFLLVPSGPTSKAITFSYYFGARKWNDSKYVNVYSFIVGIKSGDRYLDAKI